MSLSSYSHDSLPYVDAEPTEAAKALLPPPPPADHPLHPSIPPLAPTNFSPLIQAELDRLAAGKATVPGIDSARYSNPSTLNDAYTAASYLSWRSIDLHLLEKFGKNAWLISNWQLEGELALAERELEQVKKEAEEVNRERKASQLAAGEKLEALERRWKKAVDGLIQVEVANEELRQETEEIRRKIAEMR